jgi:hypothetical protein
MVIGNRQSRRHTGKRIVFDNLTPELVIENVFYGGYQ